jgi:hypothetical protein
MAAPNASKAPAKKTLREKLLAELNPSFISAVNRKLPLDCWRAL